MIDSHVHLEKGPYTLDWLLKFVKKAKERGITELYLLEHSHRFVEFKPIYNSIIMDETDIGKYQRNWFSKRMVTHLDEYKGFIQSMRRRSFPVNIKFGLEVCYFPNCEKHIKSIISNFNWDFLTGAIHWVEGWGFDHPAIKESWLDKDKNKVYQKYYQLMEELIRSNIFDHLAHPDSIKCFGHYPDYDLKETYSNIAKLIKKQKMKAEFSLGLYINYGH